MRFLPAAGLAAALSAGCATPAGDLARWKTASTGFGSVSAGGDGTLAARTMASTRTSETHAFLSLGPKLVAPFAYEARVVTDAQNRRNAPPNDWEAAWLVWSFTDRRHFYYFVAKPTGWELGKRDPAFRGGQRFLADGKEPAFPLGKWAKIRVEQDEDSRMSVYADGKLVVTFTDVQRPYRAGRVGFYGEDCEARLADVRAASGEDQLQAGDDEDRGEEAADRRGRQASASQVRADRAAD
ncbi:MAG: calcium-binding protein [Elusimicrobiota bacterium]|nr:MAG: calcium-binding protein [Elusimicrobiota bacterium]